jgi:hypothetical protein
MEGTENRATIREGPTVRFCRGFPQSAFSALVTMAAATVS